MRMSTYTEHLDPEIFSPLWPDNTVVEPHYNEAEADYVAGNEAELRHAEQEHTQGDRVYIKPEAEIDLAHYFYEWEGDLISDGATLIQTDLTDGTEAWGDWGNWQFEFTGDGTQIVTGFDLVGPLTGTDGSAFDNYSDRLVGGLVSTSADTIFHKINVSGFSHGNIMLRGLRNYLINFNSVDACYDNLGYGVEVNADENAPWSDRLIVAGGHTDNCRHHIQHGDRYTNSEISYINQVYERVDGEAITRAPFGHVNDVHRAGSKRTVWHHGTTGRPVNTAPQDSGKNQVFEQRGTPLEYTEIYAWDFDYDTEWPSNSFDMAISEPVFCQTNQGLETREDWFTNGNGFIDYDYEPENTDGVRGFDRMCWKNRDNTIGTGTKPVYTGYKSRKGLWRRFVVSGEGDNLNYSAHFSGPVVRGEESGPSDTIRRGVVSGSVASGNTDTFYAKGELLHFENDTEAFSANYAERHGSGSGWLPKRPNHVYLDFGAERVEYELIFSAHSSVRQTVEGLEGVDGRATTDTLREEITGDGRLKYTGSGKGGADAVRYYGDLEEINVDNPEHITIYKNGQEISPDYVARAPDSEHGDFVKRFLQFLEE